MFGSARGKLRWVGLTRVRRLTFGAALIAAALLLTFRVIGFAFLVASIRDGTWERPGPWVDWQTYVNAASRAFGGQGIFAPAQLSGPYLLTHVVLQGYAYPPASAPLFAVFASYPLGLAAWLTLNVGLLLTSLWALISRAWPTYRTAVFSFVLAGLAFYGPFLDGVVSASASVGVAGLIGWTAVGVTPRWLVSFGAAGGITKVFPVVLLAAGRSDKVRTVVWGALLTGGVCVLTVPVVGVGSWTDFVRAIGNSVPDCYPGNFSITCSLGPTIGMTFAEALGIAIGIGAGVALLFARDAFWMALLASIAVMAPVPNLHLHYWIVAPVLLIAGLARYQEVRRARQSRSVRQD